MSSSIALAYSAFGLRLCSTEPIPGLIPQSPTSTADLTIHLRSLPTALNEDGADDHLWNVSPYRDRLGRPLAQLWKRAGGELYHLRYLDGTHFVVDQAATRIWAVWSDELTLEDAATYLLGPVFGLVLRLRGFTCLHASAVVLQDRAIAFLGPSGAGKSTMAGAFARDGHPVLTDDVLALSFDASEPKVQPGYPRVRLWPDSAGILYGSSHKLPRLSPNWDKRYLDLTGCGYRFQARALPLAAIYLLGANATEGGAINIDSVHGASALMSLVENEYPSYLRKTPDRASEFRHLGRLARDVPMRRVIHRAEPADLQRLCDVIQDDVQRLFARRPSLNLPAN